MEIEAVVKFKHSYAYDIILGAGHSVKSFCDESSLCESSVGNFLRFKSTPGTKLSERIYNALRTLDENVDYLKLFPAQLKTVVGLFGNGRYYKKEIELSNLIDYDTDILQIEDNSSCGILETIDSKKIIDKAIKDWSVKYENSERERDIIELRMKDFTLNEIAEKHNLSSARVNEIVKKFGSYVIKHTKAREVIFD